MARDEYIIKALQGLKVIVCVAGSYLITTLRAFIA